MAAAIRLREDFDAMALRAVAKRAKDGPQARRLLALAAIYDGGARSEAAKIGTRGTSSSTSLGASCPSDYAIGLMGFDQRGLVLY